ncbi:DUF421 domain-containing protein [Enteractinococcus coprophilus]|uniref:Uncharacterized protein DUF421 n=1 Tax=Enteractinococcus coprophilus TaxID=1027633 RepID=A0A543AMV2_9MICC|nr:YetF domain-containing protein [Enteractinococcus coprophilus]TQL73889.1 uncharacterized protein DUF421 [Enteractinococcus coprophilus]
MWDEVFMFSAPVLEMFLRGTVMYLVVFLLMRFLGRRESGDLNASDIILVVLISEAASPGFGGEASSIFDSLVVVATVLFWATILDIGSYRWAWLDNLTAPRPRPLIRDGKIVQKTARREFLTKEEILSQLRINGFQELSEVKAAHLEPSGQISFLPYEENQ